MTMDNVLTALETKIDALLERVHSLEEHNTSLQRQLDEEREKRGAAVERLDRLLQKLQEVTIE
ncbi:hypothetical protein [Desulfohalobium retbaense]|uniref:Cell division protein ZapB n=1 Tax=Desulfohalobium retbaense (strain ATCC 49708 / DSM 5692 / JCM 16813 / HR100) TaxID=485915 RepID=C8X4Z6_DESRD|nr:hypothetical protein [Desulfohalobium retbaense]ACV69493.1 conserved hypothetical protein [Desulfohalobium retbaense DSM 5692]